MSSLTTNNITINKITSSNGKFSGDNASGRIELELLSNKSLYRYQVPLTINIDDSGFIEIVLLHEGSVVESIFFYESVSNFIINDLGITIDKVIIKGSRINKISAPVDLYIEIPTPPPVIGPDESPVSTISLNDVEIKLNCIQFPKDSPEEIDCENIFANWNLQGELPELDNRISNLSGAFANTQITGKLPKLPKNLKYASNTFLNCSSLTGVSKDLLAQHVTAQKPYIKYETSENMVSGCIKSVTSWFSVDNGGDHDNIEYTVWTSSRNATTSAYPYIKLNLPRVLNCNYNFRAVYKNFGKTSNSFYPFVFSSRDVAGKTGALLLDWSGKIRIDSTKEYSIAQKFLNQNRPCDLCITSKTVDELRHIEVDSLEFHESTLGITGGIEQNTTKVLTMFASNVAGGSISNPGKLAIAELDIWDDQGYLIKMRSQGTSMIDLVSGTIYSSASTTPFVTLPVEIRDIDKEDLLFWEKFSGKTLPLNFWDEYSIALADYKANPTKTEDWSVSFDRTVDVFSSSCPYFNTAPIKPVVNFFVTKCSGNYPSRNTSTGTHITARSPFASNTNQIMFFPNLSTATYIAANLTVLDTFPIIPKITVTGSAAAGYKYKGIQHIYFPNGTALDNSFHSGNATEHYAWTPKATRIHYLYTYSFGYPAFMTKLVVNAGELTQCTYLNIDYTAIKEIFLKCDFSKCTNMNYWLVAKNANAKSGPVKVYLSDDLGIDDLSFLAVTNFNAGTQDRGGFNQAIIMPKCSTATNAFLNSGLSSRNIAKTLNSLPKWTDGTVHTITFTGSPGIEWEETTETFNGVANCPRFTKDTEGKALRKAFAKAVSNGWTVEIGTATNAASTMSLRKLQYYKKTESEYGDYIDSEGKTYIISTGDAFSNEGKNLGYEQFSCIEECLESWNLTEILREEPVPFEEFIEEEQLEELEDGSNLEEYTQETI